MGGKRHREAVRRVRVRSAGSIAHAVLSEACRNGPVPVLVNRFQRFGGETVWVGATAFMHPRVAQLVPQGATPGSTGLLDLEGATVWRPRLSRPDVASTSRRLAEIGRRLSGYVAGLQDPAGYGRLLSGAQKLGFPLASTLDRVVALAQGHRLDSPQAVHAAALGLLGTGPGLTPSGDDLVAGSLFARRLAGGFDARWEAVAAALIGEANVRTSSISATLFADHLAGDSFEPLHELAVADGQSAGDALRRLVAIGQSSGWDLLTGFAIGMQWWSPGECAIGLELQRGGANPPAPGAVLRAI